MGEQKGGCTLTVKPGRSPLVIAEIPQLSLEWIRDADTSLHWKRQHAANGGAWD
jgi:hypothetical protein